MAFEDRCSPQSAPSPQGIPHTPQKSIKSDSSNISRHNYASDTSISEFTHKEEERMETDNYKSEYSIDNDDFMSEKSKEIANKFSFSISNILSENFGRAVTKNLLQKCAKKEKIFRPFEIVDTKINKHDNSRQPSPSNTSNMLFYNNLSENENSNNSMQDSYENSKNKMLIKNIQLAELLHLTSKRLYEENSKNSDRKVPLVNNFASYSRSIEELPEHNQPQHMFGPSAYVPPLGSLSKAVSQIGQSNFSDLVLPPSFSSFTSASSATTSPKYCSDNPMSPESNYKPQSASSQHDNIDSDDCKSEASSSKDDGQKMWPAWIYCTRYSDRPSSGPRYRRPKDKKEKDEKRPRTAFSNEQLTRLKREFNENRYLTEKRRQQLSSELGLNEAQIKIWFQNKRAKIKKSSGTKNALALQLMAQGLYNHSTVPLTKEEEELELRMNGKI